MGCQNTPLAAINTPSTPQPRSDLVKRPLKNTENDYHQWLSVSDSFAPHSLSSIGARSAPEPMGEITALLQAPPPAGLRGPYF